MLMNIPVTVAARSTLLGLKPSSHLISRLNSTILKRRMATVKDSIPHMERTANDPRQTGLYHANISRIELVNKRIRLIRLSLHKEGPPLRHLPGQYVDLYIPNVSVVGGFTITSPPQTAILRSIHPTSNQPIPANEDTSEYPCLDLAIQNSPSNPPAAYLWRDPATILNSPVSLRIGGDFTYPPSTLSMEEFQKIENVVFVAGGVGINPIISMVSAMDLVGVGRLGGMVKRVRILYSSKRDTNETGQKEDVLFEKQLEKIAQKYKDSREVDLKYNFFETGAGGLGRIQHQNLFDAIGEGDIRKKTIIYICGIPTMTDEFVDLLRNTDGLEERRVLCEKWW